jgi:hypothetical protein
VLAWNYLKDVLLLAAGFPFQDDLQNLFVAEFAPLHWASSARRLLILSVVDYRGQALTKYTPRM